MVLAEEVHRSRDRRRPVAAPHIISSLRPHLHICTVQPLQPARDVVPLITTTDPNSILPRIHTTTPIHSPGLDHTDNMVDVATSPAPAPSTKDAGSAPTDAAKDKAAPPSKPERPDDDQYKTDLAKAEKELKASEDKMVSRHQRDRARLRAAIDAHWCLSMPGGPMHLSEQHANKPRRSKSSPRLTSPDRQVRTRPPSSNRRNCAMSCLRSASCSSPASPDARRSWTRLSVSTRTSRPV